MSLTLDLWHVISLLMAFGGLVASFGKILLVQVEKRLDERFTEQERARTDGMHHWDERFSALETAARSDADRWQRLKDDLMQLRAELPLHYVRREDYIRGQSVIEAKIDAVFLKIDNLQLKQLERNHG